MIARSKLPTDNVTPSGNSVSAANLLVPGAMRSTSPTTWPGRRNAFKPRRRSWMSDPAAVRNGRGARRWLDVSRDQRRNARHRRPRKRLRGRPCCSSRKSSSTPFARRKNADHPAVERRRMRPGQRSYIPGAGYIRVLSVDRSNWRPLTDDDARPDGFASPTLRLREELATLYADQLAPATAPIGFASKLLSNEEQAAAMASKRKGARRLTGCERATQGPGRHRARGSVPGIQRAICHAIEAVTTKRISGQPTGQCRLPDAIGRLLAKRLSQCGFRVAASRRCSDRRRWPPARRSPSAKSLRVCRCTRAMGHGTARPAQVAVGIEPARGLEQIGCNRRARCCRRPVAAG